MSYKLEFPVHYILRSAASWIPFHFLTSFLYWDSGTHIKYRTSDSFCTRQNEITDRISYICHMHLSGIKADAERRL